MHIPSWDGTLSSSEFCLASRTFCEKWKNTNSNLPQWKWISCPKQPSFATHEVDGYLSVENICRLRSIEEDLDEGSYSEKEKSSYSSEEDYIDNATLVQCYGDDMHSYDFHIVYSSSYRVPVLYFHAYHSDGQPLALNDIERDLDLNSMKKLQESKWTFITQEEHPYLNRPWYILHPCGTSEWMKLLFLCGDSSSLIKDRAAVLKQYIISWLSVVGQVVGLRIPSEILSSLHELDITATSSVINC